jgi:hypothetical protein
MIKAVTQQQSILERRLALGLITLCVTLFTLYVYFLSASIMHVVVRTEFDHAARELRSRISVLEGEFIAAQHAVSQNIAHLEGYERVNDKVFVDRSAPSLVLNTNQ